MHAGYHLHLRGGLARGAGLGHDLRTQTITSTCEYPKDPVVLVYSVSCKGVALHIKNVELVFDPINVCNMSVFARSSKKRIKT
jgi:hypothetical protein